jgi:hypothetical protein
MGAGGNWLFLLAPPYHFEIECENGFHVIIFPHADPNPAFCVASSLFAHHQQFFNP